MTDDFRKWWFGRKGSAEWAKTVDKDILGAIEMVFEAGRQSAFESPEEIEKALTKEDI